MFEKNKERDREIGKKESKSLNFKTKKGTREVPRLQQDEEMFMTRERYILNT